MAAAPFSDRGHVWLLAGCLPACCLHSARCTCQADPSCACLRLLTATDYRLRNDRRERLMIYSSARDPPLPPSSHPPFASITRRSRARPRALGRNGTDLRARSASLCGARAFHLSRSVRTVAAGVGLRAGRAAAPTNLARHTCHRRHGRKAIRDGGCGGHPQA